MESKKEKVKSQNYSSYQSPFAWRYGSEKMRQIFSEEYKYKLWRKIWVSLAKAQAKEGLVSEEEWKDLEKNQDNLDIERIWEIEKDTRHDVVAAIKEFAEKAKVGGGKIHLGATSMDISDNAETVRMQEALILVEKNLKKLIKIFGEKIKKYADLPCMGYTHLQADEITSQAAPRKIEFWLGNLLASIAQSLNKFAFDLRILQAPFMNEWMEPFGKSQVGSSAMPFKRNPIKAEQICSLARLVINLSRTTWDNAANQLLERTLDDSANRRVVIPEMFLAIDEIIDTAGNLVEGLNINEIVITKNLKFFFVFSASESIIIEAVKKGADRQVVHEILREISMKAWEAMDKAGEMQKLLLENAEIKKYLNAADLKKLLDAKNHIGNAPQKALTLALEIDKLT